MGIESRGFASMSSKEHFKIAQKGGLAAQKSKNVYHLTPKDRSKGGKLSPANFANRSKKELQAIGRKGGKAKGRAYAS
jgi:general stress protein YciG